MCLLLGVVVDVAGRSRRAPAGAPLMQSSVRASRHLTRFRPVPLLLRARPPPRCPARGARVRAHSVAQRHVFRPPALADKLSDPVPEAPDELRVLLRDQPLAAGVPESVLAVRADLHRGSGAWGRAIAPPPPHGAAQSALPCCWTYVGLGLGRGPSVASGANFQAYRSRLCAGDGFVRRVEVSAARVGVWSQVTTQPTRLLRRKRNTAAQSRLRARRLAAGPAASIRPRIRAAAGSLRGSAGPPGHRAPHKLGVCSRPPITHARGPRQAPQHAPPRHLASRPPSKSTCSSAQISRRSTSAGWCGAIASSICWSRKGNIVSSVTRLPRGARTRRVRWFSFLSRSVTHGSTHAAPPCAAHVCARVSARRPSQVCRHGGATI